MGNRFLSSLTSSCRTWAMEGREGVGVSPYQQDNQTGGKVSAYVLAPSSLDLEPAGPIPVLKAPVPVEQPSPTFWSGSANNSFLTAPHRLGLLTALSPGAQHFPSGNPKGFTKPDWFSSSPLPHTSVSSAFINSVSVCSHSS